MLQRMYSVDQLEAPSLVGKQLQDAVAELSAYNLNIRLIDQKEDPDLPQGTILSQTPAVGQKIKPHQAIHVVISKQQEKKLCPALVKKTAHEIHTELHSLKIRNKNYFMPSAQPINHCIAQFPSAGSVLDEPRIITYLSAGNNKPVLMPNLKGKTGAQATEFFRHHTETTKLDLIHSSPQLSDHICNDQCIIVDQRPLAGSIERLDANKPLLVQLQVR